MTEYDQMTDKAVRDAAGATCRNASYALDDLAALIRARCVSVFREPADIPAEAVIALFEIENAARNLRDAANIYYADDTYE